MRAFVSIHERRQRLDELFEKSSARDAVAEGYDDVCTRLLVLDGVKRGGELRSVGHRIEFVIAALKAAKAYSARGALQPAEARATVAIEAARGGEPTTRCQTNEEEEPSEAHLRHGKRWLKDRLREAYMHRAEVRFRLARYEVARIDALEAYPIARRFGDEEGAKAAEQLALRCEFGLHGGGPGPDAKGLSPEEVDEMIVTSAGGGTAVAAFEEQPDGGNNTPAVGDNYGASRGDVSASSQWLDSMD